MSSRHRMPPGGGANSPKDNPADKDKDTPGVPEETSVGEQQTTSAGVEPTETAVEVTEPADAPSATPAADAADEAAEEAGEEATDAKPERQKHSIDWTRVLAYGVLPGIALILAMAAGYLKWQDNSVRDSDKARAEATQVAKDSTIKMLSYKPDTVDKDLNGARDLLTGDFRDQYTSLINDVVIPGAQQKKISAVATVPAVGSVSADPNKAVVLLFVNQTVVVGQDAPTDTASSVRVTLVKSGDHWLISQFDPV